MKAFLFFSLLMKAHSLSDYFYTVKNNFGNYRMRWQTSKPVPKLAQENPDMPAIVCIHGFGGNADQFRKNVPVFAEKGYDSYAIDLLGYGYSDKPNPKDYGVNEFYNFDTWSDQALSFITDNVKKPSVLVCNSIGGLVGLQAALKRPDLVKGVVLIDVSLRLLHTKKQSAFQRPITSFIQVALRETPLGKYFFKQIATPDVLRNILNQAYNYEGVAANGDGGIDDETLNVILQPGLDPGAAAVFLDFISYSGGPLPEELLPQVTCPVSILWGERDPWEPIALGRSTFANFPCVREFVTLPGGGHCPMDQIPDVVNREVLRFVDKTFKTPIALPEAVKIVA